MAVSTVLDRSIEPSSTSLDVDHWAGPRINGAPRGSAASGGVNVAEPERLGSLVVGGLLTAYGLTRRTPAGTALAALGAGLLYRGATGRCAAYRALGVSTADGVRREGASVDASRATIVKKSVTINRPAADLYRFWRRLESLPRIMPHLEDVRALDDRRSHWTAKAPAGRIAEWDAEIINDQEGTLIAWRTLPGSEIAHAGSVRFLPATGGRGTKVCVEMDYHPPAGRFGQAFARIFGEEPGQQLEDSLRRFKQLMEASELATIDGQPSGARRRSSR